MTPFDQRSPRGCASTLRLASVVVVAAVTLTLGACSRKAEMVEEVRPVRLMTLADASQRNTAVEFPGDVRARVESRLGFRVGGKLVSRLVEVGSPVRKGQPLARLDSRDLALAQQASAAQLQAAKTERDLAQAEYGRFADLAAKGFISAAELERRKAMFDGAQARFAQASAAYGNQSNQTGYTTLFADADGVVTGVDAEVGQVVAPGQPVVRVARDAEKEVAFAVPEDQVDSLRKQAEVRVRLWSMPDAGFGGRVREIAPAADPLTRTYAVRVSLPQPPAGLRLGMTAVVSLPTAPTAGDGGELTVPLTALLNQSGRTVVWVHDAASGSVKPVQVTVGAPVGNQIGIRGDLRPGQEIVTAGVHLLKPGMRVRPLDGAAGQASPKPATRDASAAEPAPASSSASAVQPSGKD